MKAGGDRQRIELSDIASPVPEPDVDLLALYDALERLEAADRRTARRVTADVSPRSGRTTAEVYQSRHLELGRNLLKPCGCRREDAAEPAAVAQRFEPGPPPVGRALKSFKNPGQLRRHPRLTVAKDPSGVVDQEMSSVSFGSDEQSASMEPVRTRLILSTKYDIQVTYIANLRRAVRVFSPFSIANLRRAVRVFSPSFRLLSFRLFRLHRELEARSACLFAFAVRVFSPRVFSPFFLSEARSAITEIVRNACAWR